MNKKRFRSIIIAGAALLFTTSCYGKNTYYGIDNINWHSDSPYFDININHNLEKKAVNSLKGGAKITKEAIDSIYGIMEVNDEILHVELMYSADSVECYIGLVDTDRDSFSEFHSILYVGGWPSIKKANVQGYDYIFTITITMSYDITHWKDDDAYGNDNRLIDEKTYAKPFDKLVLYGTHIN